MVNNEPATVDMFSHHVNANFQRGILSKQLIDGNQAAHQSRCL